MIPWQGTPGNPSRGEGGDTGKGCSPWAVKAVTTEDPWNFQGTGHQTQSPWVEHTLYSAQQAPPQAEGQHNLAPLSLYLLLVPHLGLVSPRSKPRDKESAGGYVGGDARQSWG